MPPHPEPRDAFGRRQSTVRQNQAVLDIQPRHEESRLDSLELITDAFLNNIRDLAYAQAAALLADNLTDFEAQADDVAAVANAIYANLLDNVHDRIK